MSPGPAGAATSETGAAALAQSGEFLTTAQGGRLPDTDHSLKAGERGPTLRGFAVKFSTEEGTFDRHVDVPAAVLLTRVELRVHGLEHRDPRLVVLGQDHVEKIPAASRPLRR